MSSLLQQLQQFTSEIFANEKITVDEEIRKSGATVVGEIIKNGFALRKESDKKARSIFVKIQASAERKTVDDVAKTTGHSETNTTTTSTAIEKDTVVREAYVKLQVASEKAIVDRLDAPKDLGRIAKSIWIIHTPTIATPCTNTGIATPKLLAEEIMQDESRRHLTLERTAIIRDYLKAGGVLIVAYNKAEREIKLNEKGETIIAGRTPAQIAIYETLIKEYPTQIIDFQMDIAGRKAKLNLPDDKYPEDMIGATYLVEDSFGQRFEMTNRGVQANAPRDDAEWGVWMQNRSQSVKEVTMRMAKVFSFLQNAGLNAVLDAHATKHNINQDDFAPLLNRYMSLEIDSSKGVGCRVQ